MQTLRLWVGLFAFLVVTAASAGTPDIALRGFDGKTRNVNEYIGHGKWVVVATWAHDCHICADEIHHMKDRDAMVLGVSIDGYGQLTPARTFVERLKLPFPNLIAEPSQEVMMKFGAGEFVGTPTYYIYDPRGADRRPEHRAGDTQGSRGFSGFRNPVAQVRQ